MKTPSHTYVSEKSEKSCQWGAGLGVLGNVRPRVLVVSFRTAGWTSRSCVTCAYLLRLGGRSQATGEIPSDAFPAFSSVAGL
jgi:hypothetical protein